MWRESYAFWTLGGYPALEEHSLRTDQLRAGHRPG